MKRDKKKTNIELKLGMQVAKTISNFAVGVKVGTIAYSYKITYKKTISIEKVALF